jgi:hypothetical protein
MNLELLCSVHANWCTYSTFTNRTFNDDVRVQCVLVLVKMVTRSQTWCCSGQLLHRHMGGCTRSQASCRQAQAQASCC